MNCGVMSGTLRIDMVFYHPGRKLFFISCFFFFFFFFFNFSDYLKSQFGADMSLVCLHLSIVFPQIWNLAEDKRPI